MKRKRYPIHPDFEPLSNLNPPIVGSVLPAVQKGMESLWAMEKSGSGVHVQKLDIPLDKKHSIKALLYSPENCSEPLPCLVYYHGGGFVFNAAPYHFLNARVYCREANCRVLFVDYRLAPKYRFPAAADDAFSAFRWAQINSESLNIDFHKIAVGGDSAGGSLSAAVCLMARDYGAAVPCGQMLIYPAVDLRMQTRSVRKYDDTPMCNSRDMAKYIKLYVPNFRTLSWPERSYASPAEAESLEGMPPAYVETAEFDCLHDEGVLYAQKLEEAGVLVQLNETRGTVHGYDMMTKSSVVQDSLESRVCFLKGIFHGK